MVCRFRGVLAGLWLVSATMVAGGAGCSEDTTTAADLSLAVDGGQVDGVRPDVGDQGADSAGIGRFDATTEAALQKVLSDGWKAQGAPGGTMAAQVGQTQRWSGAVGLSNMANKTAMKPGHRLRIGSVTKVFVATLVLLLDEQKTLSVEDKLSTWVPSFPKGDGIKLYQLLNHTSGVYNFTKVTHSATYDRTKPTTFTKLVQIATDNGPAFSPGAKWEYSNTNYVLLAMVVEAAAKGTWHGELRKRILDKYSLNNTFAEGYETISGDMARGYGLAGGTSLKDTTNAIHPTVAGPSGCLVSTAADLTRFFNLLHSGAILSSASLKKMRQTYSVTAVTSVKYGLGMQIVSTGGETFYTHGGVIDGFNANLMYWAKKQASVAVLFNAAEADSKKLGGVAFKALP